MNKTGESHIRILQTRINSAYCESARGELICEAVLNLNITEEERVTVTGYREKLKQISTEARQLSEEVTDFYAGIGKEGV